MLFLEEGSVEIPSEQLTHLGLSRRETEILGWIVRGKSDPEIAETLSLSVRTIHKPVEHIYLKLGVENRHAAMLVALETLRCRGLGKGLYLKPSGKFARLKDASFGDDAGDQFSRRHVERGIVDGDSCWRHGMAAVNGGDF